ncbi:hypothetical protein [Streptomyces sp. NPDC020965]|uniref:hypothetical protein n=1 Tax=Streptomyces sp. NPDC020965 TaxID=3365105 RepID=UPI0037AC8F37
MRGLKGLRKRRDRAALAASTTAMAGLAAIGMFTVACSTGGTGVQDEGSAHAEASPKSTPAPSPSDAAKARVRVDVVQLIKNDPKVNKRLRADLKPCEGSTYPVDTSYGNLTGGGAPDVVVNVVSCDEKVGVGTYVYRANGVRYENVFASEEPAVYSAIDRSELVVTRQVWDDGEDPFAGPSAEEVTTYRWAGGKFTQLHWVRNDFSGAGGGGGEWVPPSLTTTVPTED